MVYAALQVSPKSLARSLYTKMLTVEIRAPVLATRPLGARYCDECRYCDTSIHLISRQPREPECIEREHYPYFTAGKAGLREVGLLSKIVQLNAGDGVWTPIWPTPKPVDSQPRRWSFHSLPSRHPAPDPKSHWEDSGQQRES